MYFHWDRIVWYMCKHVYKVLYSIEIQKKGHGILSKRENNMPCRYKVILHEF